MKTYTETHLLTVSLPGAFPTVMLVGVQARPQRFHEPPVNTRRSTANGTGRRSMLGRVKGRLSALALATPRLRI